MFNFKQREYHPSFALRAFQYFLLALIIIGIGLIISRDTWVPLLVESIMKNDIPYTVSPVGSLGTRTPDGTIPLSAISLATSTVVVSEPLIKTALLANGCFWCVEHDLESVIGVTDVISGYAGGTTASPTYEDYVEGGHREVVMVTYDASQVTYANLVEHIIKHGDPTDADGSFNDRGLEYAPAIYYDSAHEQEEAYRVIHAIDTLHVFAEPLPIVVIPRVKFYRAEEYHQDYSEKNPLKYNYYRTGSGRTAFIEETWKDELNTFTIKEPVIMETSGNALGIESKEGSWNGYRKPDDLRLRATLTPLQYEVTQEEGTENPFTNEYDKNYESGIYVDIVSGEPLYFSKDKFDSGTGWPSFVKPISDDALTLTSDNTFFTKRTEVRSKYAHSHLGHVFDDGPALRGGKRYCMNSAAMRFIPESDLEREGYAYLIPLL